MDVNDNAGLMAERVAPEPFTSELPQQKHIGFRF